jgi:hypothetical protein
MVQLLAVSLVIGLMLVSLDITPGWLLGLFSEIGPSLQSFGGGLWRTAEILAACLLAGGAIVVPAWLIQRYRSKQRSAAPTLDHLQSIAAAARTPPTVVKRP